MGNIGRPPKYSNPTGRTWQCGVCMTVFTRLSGLKTHMRRVHFAPDTMADRETRIGYPMWGRLVPNNDSGDV